MSATDSQTQKNAESSGTTCCSSLQEEKRGGARDKFVTGAADEDSVKGMSKFALEDTILESP